MLTCPAQIAKPDGLMLQYLIQEERVDGDTGAGTFA